jgi:hypothetical protein
MLQIDGDDAPMAPFAFGDDHNPRGFGAWVNADFEVGVDGSLGDMVKNDREGVASKNRCFAFG